jgi:hypothetical protein
MEWVDSSGSPKAEQGAGRTNVMKKPDKRLAFPELRGILSLPR